MADPEKSNPTGNSQNNMCSRAGGIVHQAEDLARDGSSHSVR